MYVASQHAYTTDHALAQVAKRVPAGVFCLLTALRFHGLTTQSPAEVWVALPTKARKPQLDYPRLRLARFSGAALSEGIETHRVEGVDIRIYSAAKTVADSFKYRNKVGITSQSKPSGTSVATIAVVRMTSRTLHVSVE